MRLLERFAFFLRVSRSHGIARRYLVVNGFDGALTMLGLCTGFLVGGGVSTSVAIRACLGAAIALAMSGATEPSTTVSTIATTSQPDICAR